MSDLIEYHNTDDDGNPQGGRSYGTGFEINWQSGPLGSGDDRKEPNGAFVETIIKAAIGRLKYYQSTKFACTQNVYTIQHLENALQSQQFRTQDRSMRGVEGLNEI